MTRRPFSLSAVFLAAILIASCQSNAPVPQPTRVEPTPPSTAFLRERGRTTAPFQFLVFCQQAPRQCDPQGGADRVAMTEATEQKIQSINAFVNRTIAPKDDPPGEDIWTLSPEAGDCEDYAVTKRRDLIAGGIPGKAIRIALGTTSEGEPHAVVVVRTQRGDVVLDNRNDELKPFAETDISWIKIESADNPRVWYAL